MGGQASTLASCSACVQQYDIRASVLHHPANGQLPYGNIGVNISIPTAAFTSSGDSISSPSPSPSAMGTIIETLGLGGGLNRMGLGSGVVPGIFVPAAANGGDLLVC